MKETVRALEKLTVSGPDMMYDRKLGGYSNMYTLSGLPTVGVCWKADSSRMPASQPTWRQFVKAIKC